VILVDTSAWIEYLRGTGSRVHRKVRTLVESDERLATSEVVVMEVLAGARDDAHEERLRRLMLGCEVLPLDGLSDYEDAASLYRRCRRARKPVRSLTDCLIAVVVLRAGAEILHADRDFDTIARHAPLRVASLATSP
jgi:predicted nucleic acid-binding protein